MASRSKARQHLRHWKDKQVSNTPNKQPIAMDIYERKEMNANGEGGSVWNDLSHALETGDFQEFEEYFGDEDPFSYL